MSLFKIFNSERRIFVPEVIQTSSMDCGPATLKSVLKGYNISVSYEGLREACQTDISGTSINTIEDIAVQLGLDAEQVIVQKDHLLLSETEILPAIVVIRLPDGCGHFVVVWRTHGNMVQIMDPSVGRIWIARNKLLDMLYPYSQIVDIDIWKKYSKTDIFCKPLKRRMLNLNISNSEINCLIKDAKDNNDWRSMATLDASVRLLDTIANSGAFINGNKSEKILSTWYELGMKDISKQIIPKEYYSVMPLSNDKNNCEEILLKGALLIHIAGRNNIHREEIDDQVVNPISKEINAAIHDEPVKPEKEFYDQICDNKIWPSILLMALTLASFNLSIEALILMGFMTIGIELTNDFSQQPITMLAIFIFLVGLLFIETPINSAILKIGRRFEILMRLKFLKKIPKLGDNYFRSRLNSDMAQRAHDMRLVRKIPEIITGIYRLVFQIIITVIGIIWLMPTKPFLPIVAGIIAVIIPIFALPLLKEQDLRFRTFTGSLARFCLDALNGLTPLRSHSAEKSIRYEHENILCKWKTSGISYLLFKSGIIGACYLLNIGLSIWIVYEYILHGGSNNCIFLLIYWTIELPELGIQLANTTSAYTNLRNRILRLLEPINASLETEITENDYSDDASLKEKNREGIKININDVSVIAGGQTILSNINLSINPGEHIAIVGSSGSGKSSLMRLLLGLYGPAKGQVLIDDGNSLLSTNINSIRRETAWVDPCVQIWNRSLSDNILYGNGTQNNSLYGTIMEQTGLIKILNGLENGNDTMLGEGGRLVSGGEGQRVRLGRGMYKKHIRFVILDEPFRGLHRKERSILLKKALDYWKTCTLFFISHDVKETLNFDRILVIENGTIIEDGAPIDLMLKNDSKYRKIIKYEEKVRKDFLEKVDWKKLWIENGEIKN